MADNERKSFLFSLISKINDAKQDENPSQAATDAINEVLAETADPQEAAPQAAHAAGLGSSEPENEWRKLNPLCSWADRERLDLYVNTQATLARFLLHPPVRERLSIPRDEMGENDEIIEQDDDPFAAASAAAAVRSMGEQRQDEEEPPRDDASAEGADGAPDGDSPIEGEQDDAQQQPPPVEMVEVYRTHPETCTPAILYELLEKANITYGVDRKAVDEYLADINNIQYNIPITVARGIEAIAGVDGQVEELFKRESRPRFDERPDGSIDFKNMHLVNNVKEGQIICNILLPTRGTPGVSVYDRPIPCYNGKMPFIPCGENIRQIDAEEGFAQLVATCGGNLAFKNDHFRVEPTFTVEGDVDNGVGNINFTGDVVVMGGVREGFSITTNGNVTVNGQVEGANITAGGCILLSRGVNGMRKGMLEAKKGVTANYIENCTVRAGEDVVANSIINSVVETDGNVTVGGKGILVGGKITAFGSVVAKVVGTRYNTATEIVLGVTPSMQRERTETQQQHQAVTQEAVALQNDVTFLMARQYNHDPVLQANRDKKLEQYQSKLKLVLFKKSRLEKKLQQFVEQQRETQNCVLLCDEAYPPLRVVIGSNGYTLRDEEHHCCFYESSKGEVVLGHTSGSQSITNPAPLLEKLREEAQQEEEEVMTTSEDEADASDVLGPDDVLESDAGDPQTDDENPQTDTDTDDALAAPDGEEAAPTDDQPEKQP